MEFNSSKCQVLHISRPRQPILSQYSLHGEILESVNCARYLQRPDLEHPYKRNKANRTLGFVKRSFKTKNQSVKELAYKTFVRPKVEYASTVWSAYTDKRIDQIEMVQRRAAGWVSNRY